MKQQEYKKTLSLDFDGVIHSYTSGWKGASIIPDEPVSGAFEAIEQYLDQFKVVIYSSRSSQLGGVEAMKAWFLKHGFNRLSELEFPSQKPAAFLTIDDRALCFDGIFPPVGVIHSFKPWYFQEYKLDEVFLVDDPAPKNVKLSDMVKDIVKEVLKELDLIPDDSQKLGLLTKGVRIERTEDKQEK